MDPEENTKRLNRAKWALWHCLQANCPGYVADLHNSDALTGAAHWLIQQPYNAVSPGMGLILRGPVGTGKTDLMRAISGAVSGSGGVGFGVVNIKRIVAEYARKGDRGTDGGTDVVLRYAGIDHLCIDDVGQEEDGKHFGAVANVFADLIALRYERWRSGGQITHITTNLDNAAMLRRYDDRTVSRIGEMCGELYLGGDDRRGTADPMPSRLLRSDLFSDVPPMPEVSAEKAAEYFAAIRSVVKSASIGAAMEITEANESAPTQAQDLAAFAGGLAAKSDEELHDLITMLIQRDTYGSSKVFVEAVDAELARRAEAMDKMDHQTTIK